VWLGPVRITPAVYGELGRAISACFGMGAVLCGVGIALSLARGRMHALGGK